ncbi:MAG: hypothetical protein ACTHY4_03390 [Flavobacteriaceae bacterium]
MKKIMFILSFIFMTSFAFANLSEISEKSKVSFELNFISENLSSLDLSSEDYYTCTVLHVIYVDGEYVGEYYVDEPDDSPNCNGVVFHMFKKAPGH